MLKKPRCYVSARDILTSNTISKEIDLLVKLFGGKWGHMGT